MPFIHLYIFYKILHSLAMSLRNHHTPEKVSVIWNTNLYIAQYEGMYYISTRAFVLAFDCILKKQHDMEYKRNATCINDIIGL